MSNPLATVPSFPEERRLKDADNWHAFKSHVINTIRAKTLQGYLEGTISQPPNVLNLVITSTTTATPYSSMAPSYDEWLQREGWVAGVLYQNIIDPDAHSISPDQPAVTMWTDLKTKFDVTKADFKDHLHKLSKFRVAANAMGCNVSDAKMISIILASLPPSWIYIVQVQQGKTSLAEVTRGLTEFWVFKNRDKVIANVDPSALTATTSSRPERNPVVCDNCKHRGHGKEKCWARGGRQEGKVLKL
ncbi:hypothetical protein F5050DRAFT_1898835 [Lentinula boryana]|uniref:Uncharacterized protein n=1 Tax=Lentinula boryana TaxID=40481 RepID=A0ABQ8PW12_9AGAR|nr:hypothetical protein F5050DRAFT_1898835 [Lentinula boryana]